jgi:hypothetical protein
VEHQYLRGAAFGDGWFMCMMKIKTNAFQKGAFAFDLLEIKISRIQREFMIHLAVS